MHPGTFLLLLSGKNNSTTLLTTTVSFNNNGDIIYNDGKSIQQLFQFIGDGNLSENCGRISFFSNKFVGDISLTARNNVLFGGNTTFQGDGDLYTNAGTSGFSYLFSTSYSQIDGDFSILPNKFTQSTIGLITDSSFSEQGIRSRYGNFSYNNNVDISLNDNAFLGGSLQFINYGDFGSSDGMSGFQYLSSNTYLEGDGDFGATGGLIVPFIQLGSSGNFWAQGDAQFNCIRMSQSSLVYNNSLDLLMQDNVLAGDYLYFQGDGDLETFGGESGPMIFASNAYYQADGDLITNGILIIPPQPYPTGELGYIVKFFLRGD